jgi:RecA-family ATPase
MSYSNKLKADVKQIPDKLQERLDASPPYGEGNGRHDDIRDISLQLIGEGFSDEETFGILRDRYADQPDKTDDEIRDLIKGAHSKNPQPSKGKLTSTYSAPTVSRATIKPFEYEGNLATASDTLPASDLSTADFLRLAFKPGETICINVNSVERNGKHCVASSGTFQTLEWWLEFLNNPLKQDFFKRPQGAWIRVNPLRAGTEKGEDKDVTDFRHLLIESDSLPKAQQWEIYKESGLPITSVTDSGGDSLHAWVRLDAKNKEEYAARAADVYAYLSNCGFDAGNKNPSRFSRLPGAVRNGVPQQLIATNKGAKSWEEWESNVRYEDGLPDDDDVADLMETPIKEPKHLLKDFLRVGQVGIISGAAKTFKSWTVKELALAVSQGKRFLKWDAVASKVYYIDTELEKYDFKKRLGQIAHQRGATIDKGEIRKLLLRGIRTDLDKLVKSLSRRLKGKGYELICIDAIYSVLGDREENSNEDIAEIGALLFELANATGAAVLFTHHYSKGSQKGKRGIEKASGAGSWGRFPDVSLSVDQHADADCFNFEPTFRTFAPQAAFVARRNGSVWDLENGLKVESKGAAGATSNLTDMLDLLVNEGNGELSVKDWFQLCEDKLGLTYDQCEKRKLKIVKTGLLAPRKKNEGCKLAEGVEKDENGVYGQKKIEYTVILSGGKKIKI